MEKELANFGQIIEEIDHVSQEMIEVIDKQTQAVVASDEQQIEHCAEQYTDLRGSFEDLEHTLAQQLQAVVSPAEGRNGLKLEQLMQVFPESSEKISRWKQALHSQILELKQKHQKLNELLQFALDRNTELMRSIYAINNQKNTRYSPAGDKQEISSGTALNKEA